MYFKYGEKELNYLKKKDKKYLNYKYRIIKKKNKKIKKKKKKKN